MNKAQITKTMSESQQSCVKQLKQTEVTRWCVICFIRNVRESKDSRRSLTAPIPGEVGETD